MIRIETVNSDNPSISIMGTDRVICTELLIVITKLIENNMLKDEDRNIIKLITGLDKTDAIAAQEMLKNSLHIVEDTDKNGGTNND